LSEKLIDLNETIYDLCKDDSEIPLILSELGFKDITRPGMISTAGKIMTINKGATLKKIDIDTIKEKFISKGYKITGGL
jgi:selenophosphate synthetase-related protein